MDFNNLVDNLGNILRESSNLYSFSACTIIVIAVLCFVFYIRSSGKDRNRAFYFTLLCFIGLALATLTAGLVGGFQQGNEVGLEQGVEETQEQIQRDPSVVVLSDSSARTLDRLITADGNEVNPESKSLMIEKTIREFSNSLEQRSIEKPSWIQEKEGFIFNFQGCSRKPGSTTVICNLLVTNKEKDRNLTLYASANNDESTIVDSQGVEYNTRDAALGNEPDQSGWYARNTLPNNVEVSAWVKFENVSTEINRLQIAKFELTTDSRQEKFDIRYPDVPVIEA